MGKDDLNVASFCLKGAHVAGNLPNRPDSLETCAADVRSNLGFSLPDDGIQLKILRGKTLVLEWGQLDSVQTMHTTRTKLEVPLADLAQPEFEAGMLRVRLIKAPTMLRGSQGWDYDKRQRQRCEWYAGAPISAAAPMHSLYVACGAAEALVVALTNTEAKVRKMLAPLLTATAAAPKAKANPGSKRTGDAFLDGCARDAVTGEPTLEGMTVGEINKLLRQAQSGGSSSSSRPAGHAAKKAKAEPAAPSPVTVAATRAPTVISSATTSAARSEEPARHTDALLAKTKAADKASSGGTQLDMRAFFSKP
jgi:hypothetical protein